MNIKKMLVCVLCLLLALSSAACAAKPASAPSDPEANTAPTSPNVDPLPAENKLGLEPENLETNSLFNYGLVAVKVGEKWGYINLQGEMIIEPQFDNCNKFRQGLLAINNNGTYHFINTKGEAVSEPNPGMASFFTENYCIVRTVETEKDGNVIGWNQSIIDQSGEVCFQIPGNSNCWPVRDGKLFVQSESGVSIYTPQGEMLFALEGVRLFEGDESTYRIFFDGLMSVQQGDKWGAVNTEGQWVIEPQFDRLSVFENGLAKAHIGDRYGYIRTDGTWVVEPQFIENYDHFSEGLVGAQTNDKMGYIDTQGNWKIVLDGFEWVILGEFNEGYAYVDSDLGAGLIDTNGNWVISPTYLNLSDVKFGLAAAEETWLHWGYVNTSGEMVVPAEYRHATGFYDDGYAIAQKNDGKWVIIDTDGHVVLDGGFDGIGNFYTSYREDGTVEGTGQTG